MNALAKSEPWSVDYIKHKAKGAPRFRYKCRDCEFVTYYKVKARAHVSKWAHVVQMQNYEMMLRGEG